MQVCGQTLVLVDNDATVSEVNQKLVKATLKYMFYHRRENRAFCFSTYEHDISMPEEYGTDASDLVYNVDAMEFEAKDSNLSDTLSEVITRWKESDFACRDILVFTDGLEGSALFHEKEELYYLLENTDYPVYIVMLDQDNKDAKKGLSAIAVTSGGKMFESEFAGSDAAVDRQISEKVFSAMDEYAAVNWAKYEDADDTDKAETTVEADDDTGIAEEQADAGTDEQGTDETTSEVLGEEYLAEPFTEEGVIYERSAADGFFESTEALVLSVVLIAAGIIAGIVGSFIIMKKRRRSDRAIKPKATHEDEYFDDYELGGMSTGRLPSNETSETVLLGEGRTDSPTRLLTADCPIVTLTQSNGSGRSFRIVLAAPMSIGRGDCDVVITGDDAISKRHCELYVSNGDVYVKDLSSANGTVVNNSRVQKERLREGDRITIGAGTYIVGIA